ncbi:MAG: hypothetical protein KDB60_08100 [Propionibacteriaceae bacterium]|nr:hypothetical protein [Propionibacteriaceae bacterium]
MARITPCLENGKIAQVPREWGAVGGSTEFIVLRAGGRVLPDFVYLWAQSRDTHAAAIRRMIGTTGRQRVGSADYGDLPILIPPASEQQRIVDLIGTLDDAITAVDREREESESTRGSICAAAQASGVSTPLADLAVVSQGKSLPKAIQGSKLGSTPWYKIADMAQLHNVHGYTRAETMLTAEGLEKHGGQLVSPGAVVFPRVGAAVLTEKKRLVLVEGAVDENHLVLTPRQGTDSEVLLAVMERLKLSDLVQTGAVPSLNMGLIRSTKVSWPADSVGSLGEVLGQFRESLVALTASARRLRGLRSQLLTALLSGEHEIPESYDDLMEVAS